MDQRFRKFERLKSRKLIQKLFREGKSLKAYPIIAVYYGGAEHESVQVGFSVSKRRFRKAVDRNLLKRRMREAYRLNRGELGVQNLKGVALMLIYVGKDPADFGQIEKSVRKALSKLMEAEEVEVKQSAKD